MDCAVLLPLHLCISVDLENCWIPPPPPMPAPIPYYWAQFLFGVSFTSKTATKTFAWSMTTMHQDTDIGKFIVHIGNPANVLLPAIIAFSSSKSLFGASTVEIEGKVVGTAALVFANVNLNCSSPMPSPRGMVVAPNTVLAGMKFGDYLAGALNMAFQRIISYAMGKLVGKVFPPGSKAGVFTSSEYWKAAGSELFKKAFERYVRNPTFGITSLTAILRGGAKDFANELGESLPAHMPVSQQAFDSLSDVVNDFTDEPTAVAEAYNAATDAALEAAEPLAEPLKPVAEGIQKIGDGTKAVQDLFNPWRATPAY